MMKIPKGWRIVKLGDVVQKVNRKIKEEERLKFDRYIAGEHIKTEEIRINDYGLIDGMENVLGSAFHVKFEPEDILFLSRRAYLRKSGIVNFEGICSNVTFVLRGIDGEIINNFIPFILQSESFIKHATDNSHGSTNPFLNWKDIAKYKFFLPPIDQQKKMNKLLWAIEDNIEKTENLIEINDKLKMGLLNELLTKGIGHKKFKKTEIGEIPEEWELVKIGELCIVNSGGSAPQEKKYFGGNNKFIRVQHLDQSKNQINGFDLLTDEAVKKHSLKIFKKGTTIFPKSGATVYLEKRVLLPFDSYIVSHLCCISSSDEFKLLPEYIFYLFRNMNLAPNKNMIQYPTINLADIKKIKIGLPLENEQKEILRIISSVGVAKTNLEDNLVNLINLKKKLTDDLISGKITLK